MYRALIVVVALAFAAPACKSDPDKAKEEAMEKTKEAREFTKKVHKGAKAYYEDNTGAAKTKAARDQTKKVIDGAKAYYKEGEAPTGKTGGSE